MNSYAIFTDVGCDVEPALREQFDIDCIYMHYTLDGEDYEERLEWKRFSVKEYYDLIRNGKRIYTTQANVENYKTSFKKYLDEGKDVLYIGCSSQLSASVKSSFIARDELQKEYPDRKIICIDAKRGCYAGGILALTASEMRADGKSIDEVATWVEENKTTSNMIGTIDDLKYLRRAGRISATSAFFAGLLNIKPIVIADAIGRNFAMEKVKGKKKAMERVAQLFKESYRDVPYQKVYINHSDCIEDVEFLKNELFKQLGKEIPVHVGYVGPIVGASVGPGMLCVNFFGQKVTLNEEEN